MSIKNNTKMSRMQPIVEKLGFSLFYPGDGSYAIMSNEEYQAWQSSFKMIYDQEGNYLADKSAEHEIIYGAPSVIGPLASERVRYQTFRRCFPTFQKFSSLKAVQEYFNNPELSAVK